VSRTGQQHKREKTLSALTQKKKSGLSRLRSSLSSANLCGAEILELFEGKRHSLRRSNCPISRAKNFETSQGNLRAANPIFSFASGQKKIQPKIAKENSHRWGKRLDQPLQNPRSSRVQRDRALDWEQGSRFHRGQGKLSLQVGRIYERSLLLHFLEKVNFSLAEGLGPYM